MKGFILLFAMCCSLTVQAGYKIHMPLEASNDGRLPDGSIIFVGNDKPTTPETPEEVSDCEFDISGKLFAEIAGYGEVVEIRFYNGQQIANGTKGKEMMVQDTATYSEICMNGQAPKPFVPEAEWENGSCKYNSGLGFDSPRYWTDTYDVNDNNIKLFLMALLGSYEGHGSLSRGKPGIIFPSEWKLVDPFDVQMTQANSSKKITYNGYQYYRGQLKDTRPDTGGDEPSKRSIYYYEICRTKI